MKHFMRSLKLLVADYKRNRAKPNCICGRLNISWHKGLKDYVTSYTEVMEKLSLWLIQHLVISESVEVAVWLHVFLTSSLFAQPVLSVKLCPIYPRAEGSSTEGMMRSLSWSESLRDHKPKVLQGICPGLAGGRPNFYGKGQDPLLWAGSWAANGKIISATTNLLNYGAIFVLYTQFKNVAVDHVIQPGRTRAAIAQTVGGPWTTHY
jgi:hypothetical protein